MSTIDLNSPPPNHQYSVSVEREETAGERRMRLFKDVTLFVVAIFLLCSKIVSQLDDATDQFVGAPFRGDVRAFGGLNPLALRRRANQAAAGGSLPKTAWCSAR